MVHSSLIKAATVTLACQVIDVHAARTLKSRMCQELGPNWVPKYEPSKYPVGMNQPVLLPHAPLPKNYVGRSAFGNGILQKAILTDMVWVDRQKNKHGEMVQWADVKLLLKVPTAKGKYYRFMTGHEAGQADHDGWNYLGFQHTFFPNKDNGLRLTSDKPTKIFERSGKEISVGQYMLEAEDMDADLRASVSKSINFGRLKGKFTEDDANVYQYLRQGYGSYESMQIACCLGGVWDRDCVLIKALKAVLQQYDFHPRSEKCKPRWNKIPCSEALLDINQYQKRAQPLKDVPHTAKALFKRTFQKCCLDWHAKYYSEDNITSTADDC